jgi:D-amino-acid dehydrogenase
MARADAIVIGGGIVGVASAWHLAERGARVVLLEKGEVGAGASYGNAGWMSPSHGTPLPSPGVIRQGLRWLLDPESPFYVKPRLEPALIRWLFGFMRAATAARSRNTMRLNRELTLRSLALTAELVEKHGLDFGLERRGLVVVCESEDGRAHAEEERHALRALGGEGRTLAPDDVRELEPRVSPHIAGGVFFPDDAHLRPFDLVNGLASLARARNVEILTGQDVLTLERDGARVARVVTTRGEFTADEFVLAAGAWSPLVAKPLGLRLPVQAAKGYSVTVECPPDFGSLPLLLSEAKVAITPLGGGRLRFAGTLELAGLDLSVNMRRVAAILRAVERFLPGLTDAKLIETWRGLRPLTPDDLPILGRPRACPNLIVATGHGMSGISQGVMTGKLVSELARGERPSLDVTPFSPDRFA